MPRTTKVLHIGAGTVYGGIERVLVAYAAGSSVEPRISQEFAVAFPGQLMDELRYEGFEATLVGPARFRNLFSVAHSRVATKELLERFRPDAVISHGPWVHCLVDPVVRGFGAARILALHSPPGLHWLDLLARQKGADLVITFSRFTLTASLSWLGAIPATTCMCPVRPRSVPSARDARERLGISSSTVIILQVGRLDPYKGHLLHLRALAKLPREQDWRAWFVGAATARQSGYERSVRRLSHSLGLSERVSFLGHRTDVSALMDLADVFSHPNIRPEPFGVVFVEAMQAGLPIVATRMGGAAEILAEGGGVLVEPNADAVAAALEELLRDRARRQAVGELGRDIAARTYSLERGIRDLAAAIDKCMSLKRQSMGAVEWD